MLEGIYVIFGTNNFIVFQILNCLAILFILKFLYKITGEIFEDKRTANITKLLSAFLLPLFLYATFIYGEVVSLCFVSGAFYMTLRYMKSDKIRFIVFSGFMLGVAVILKANSYIAVIAMCIILILKALRDKKWIPVFLSLCLMFIPLSMNGILNSGYELAAGIEQIPEGPPSFAWVAMGLQENEAIECGWYNGYVSKTYKNSGYDREKMAQDCIRSLKDSITGFVTRPGWALHYFHHKFVSQWNDPTCMGIIVNEWASRHSESRGAPAMWLIYGDGGDLVSFIMNIYQSLILVCACVFCIREFKRITLEQGMIVLLIFGGYLCHMFWEAKGRYALGYFVMMLPLAAGGMNRIIDSMDQKIEKIKQAVKEKRPV